MNFTFVQMPFNVNCVTAVNKSDIASTTHVYESAVYFLRFVIQIFISLDNLWYSAFSDSARSMIDLDIWLTFLLLLSSFFPTCNTMWFGLNSQIAGYTWSCIQITLNSSTERSNFNNCFRVRSIKKKRIHRKYRVKIHSGK